MSIIKENIRQYAIFIALIFIAVLFQGFTGGFFFEHFNLFQAFQDGLTLTPVNMTNVIQQNSYIFILAIGMTLVIVTGRIDLSVGSTMGLAGAVSGFMIVDNGLPVVLTIPVVLAVGLLVGAWQGYWIAYKNMPFFVVTLAGMMLWRGLTMLILDGRMIGPFPDSFQMMSAGFVPDFLGGGNLNHTAIAVCVLIAIAFVAVEFRKRSVSSKYQVEDLPFGFFVLKLLLAIGVFGLFGYWFGLHNGIPNVFVLVGTLVLIYSYITGRTILGRHIYATGGNARTSALSGVKTKQIVFWVYVNMSILAALAGMVFVARLNAANPRAGVGGELEAIAAAFIGGASPSGGIGKVSGAIAGAMIVGLMDNGMSILGASTAWRQVATGLLLLAAVIFDVLLKSKSAGGAK